MPCSHWPTGASHIPRNPVCTQGRSRLSLRPSSVGWRCLHSGTWHSIANSQSGFRPSAFGPRISYWSGRAMRPKGYFTQVGQGVFAAVSTRTFQVGAAGLSSPALERFGIIPPRRWRRRNLFGVLQAIKRKSLDQLSFGGGAAILRIHSSQMPCAAEHQDDADQGGDEPRPKVMALDVAQRGVQGGLRDALHGQAQKSPNWRRRMGIEPTWDFVEPHHGFEDQERHQVALRLQENEPRRLRLAPQNSASTFSTRVTSGAVM